MPRNRPGRRSRRLSRRCSRAWRGSGFCGSRARRGAMSQRRIRWFMPMASPLAQSPQGTVFFHDFQPGTYRLTVQAYGTPANLVNTLQLAAGTAGLCSGPGSAQLGNGLERRGREFCRADDGAAGGPGVSADDDQSRSALTLANSRYRPPARRSCGAAITATSATVSV